MMKFACTESMDVETQVKVISDEIQKEYPEILADKILEMSVLSNTVHKNVTEDTMFQRYYIILELLEKNSPLYNKVYSDMINICYEKLKNKIYYDLCNDLIKYQNGLISEFPCISDYFEEDRPTKNIAENNKEYNGDILEKKNKNEEKVEELIDTVNNEGNSDILPVKMPESKTIWEKIKEFFKSIFRSKKK